MTALNQIRTTINARRVAEIAEQMATLQAELDQLGHPPLDELIRVRITEDGAVRFYCDNGVCFIRNAGALGRELRDTIEKFYTKHTKATRVVL